VVQVADVNAKGNKTAVAAEKAATVSTSQEGEDEVAEEVLASESSSTDGKKRLGKKKDGKFYETSAKQTATNEGVTASSVDAGLVSDGLDSDDAGRNMKGTAKGDVEGKGVAGPAGSGGAKIAEVPMSASRTPLRMAMTQTSESQTSSTMTNVQQSRFTQRVANALLSAQQRGGDIRLRLNPPELGVLRIEIKMEAGVMRTHIEAETQAAKTLLMDNLAGLRDRLAEHNIKIEQFDVGVMDRQNPGSSDVPQDNSHRQDRQHASGDPSHGTARESDTSKDGTALKGLTPAGSLDVVI